MFKKTLAISFLLFNFSNASGIPTTDALNIAESIAQHNETLQQWATQIRAMEKQYNAISKMNSWKDVLDSQYFWDFFPKEAEEIVSGKVSLEDVLNKINKAIENDETFKEFKKEELDRVATRSERAKENYNAASERAEEIKRIIDKQGENIDLKDSIDYGNLLQGKLALMVNELTRIQSENQIYDADLKEREKIEEERYNKFKDASKGVTIYKIN